MMSIGPAPPAAEAADYYGKDNYYVKEDPERAVGVWFGKGAKALGLEGAVDLKDFENVLAGRLPNGVVLGKKVGGDLIHRPGDDLTFSMPKSAALLATVGGDTRILAADKESVLRTLGYIERNYVETRAKERGVMRREKTGKMVAALFEHDVSRNLDPQPHIHAVVANVTQRRDGKWRSIHNVPIWKNAKLFTQIQSAYFAKGLTDIGYAVEWKETAGHVEIKDFPRDVIEAFSTRSRDIQRVFETLDHKTPETRSKVALKIVTLVDSTSRERDWSPSDLKRDSASGSLESFRRDTLTLQAGDRVKWTASDWRRGFRTNETAWVASVSKENIAMETASGEAISLPRNDPMAAHLDHAYAMTANEAQGKTAERAIAVIDSKEKNLATRRRFYIQISRVKTDLSLVVDSKEEAQKQISRFSGDKTSALETMEQASKRGEPMMDLGNDQADSSVPQQEQDRQLEIRLDRS